MRRVILLKDNEATGLDSSLVKLSSKPVEEDKEPQGPQPTVASFMDTDEEPKTTEQEVSNKEKRSVDSEKEYEEFNGVLSFEHQDVQYYVSHSNNLSKEEKDTIIGDVKNSHESLVNKYGELSKMQSSDCISVIIDINSDKKISVIASRGANSDNIYLEPSLISGNNAEEEPSAEELANLPQVSEDLEVDPNNLQSEAGSSLQITEPPKSEPSDLGFTVIKPKEVLPEVEQPTLEEEKSSVELQGDEPHQALHTSELQTGQYIQESPETQSSDVGLISSFIYILTKPLSLALSAITSVISWVFGFDEKEPGATHHDNNHALPEPSADEVSEESDAAHNNSYALPETSADDVPYGTSSNDVI